MFPKGIPYPSSLPTPSISYVIQNQDNYEIAYSRTPIQSFETVLFELLLDDVVVDSFSAGPYPISTTLSVATWTYPGYTQGVTAKVRVSNGLETKTSAGVTSTYARLDSLNSMSINSAQCVRKQASPTKYSWQVNFTGWGMVDGGYYDQQLTITLEARTVGAPFYIIKATKILSWDSDTNNYSYIYLDDGDLETYPDEYRITVAASAAGYSTSAVQTGTPSGPP